MLICQVCGNGLQGKQTKFCSNGCKNNTHQGYVKQGLRGKTRRNELISLAGGCCQHCGYTKNTSALEFHHVDPSIKKFNLDMRRCSNCNWESLLEESKKCILICSNCHAELHNPQ